jgi:hypothetical protein
MIVADLIKLAKVSELKQLPVAKIAPGDQNYIDNQIALIGMINLGLIDIYARHALKKVTQEVDPVVNGTSVTMGADYLYLFYACGTNDAETEIPIQNEWATFTVFENSPFEITFVRDDELNTEITAVNLTYISAPTFLTDEADVIPLKRQYLEPLILYMAYKAHSGITAKMDEDNNVYFQRYLGSLKALKVNGLETPDNQSNYKMFYKGFR